MFAEKNDQTWSGGDQTTSFKAPNGRVYWISADTMLSNGVDRDGSYPDTGTTMINSRIMLQDGGRLENAMANGAVAIPLPPRTPEDQERHWPQGAFVAGATCTCLVSALVPTQRLARSGSSSPARRLRNIALEGTAS
ncbi:MAG TPA: hypothetical protein VGW38_10300 [Chloroflexota bacterium]|nr:hypothetical protein [Chloroflexota bacterium]